LQAGQPVASYTYDIFDRRIKKSARGSVTHFHYDIDDNLIAETDANGSLLKAYIWLNDEPVAMVTAGGSIYYYHNDHLGTPQKMTNENGALVWAADYLPFGEADVTIETIENNLRFPGQYYDSETGLHYNYHRYYDPSTGRYLTPDPIGLDGGLNLYAYARNNPIMIIDPTGEFGLFGAIVGGVSGAIGGFSSGLISGGDWKAAIVGGLAGGVAGAAVGSINIFGASAAGQAIGGIVGGAVGGGVGGAVSDVWESGTISRNTLNSAGKGALAGGASAAFASPVVVMSAVGGSTATTLTGAIGGITGDLVISTGVAIYNSSNNSGEK
jgi:RHS repeat-associated protein